MDKNIVKYEIRDCMCMYMFVYGIEEIIIIKLWEDKWSVSNDDAT